jgi:hypothetical protein
MIIEERLDMLNLMQPFFFVATFLLAGLAFLTGLMAVMEIEPRGYSDNEKAVRLFFVFTLWTILSAGSFLLSQ